MARAPCSILAGGLTAACCALIGGAAVAAAQDSPDPSDPVAVPGTNSGLAPLSLGRDERVELKDQPNPAVLPVFVDPRSGLSWFPPAGQGPGFARPTPGSGTIKRVGIVGGGTAADGGVTTIYVAAGGQNRVYMYDAATLVAGGSFNATGSDGSCPAGSWQSIQSIAYAHPPIEVSEDQAQGELFVLGKINGKQEIRAFDEAGANCRKLPFVAPDLLGPFEGMDAAFGELWLTTSPARDGNADRLGQQVVLLDDQTGAVKGLGRAPLDDTDASNAARSWWDISVAPELKAAIVDRTFFDRGLLLPGVILPGSPLCATGLYYTCASTNQAGTDAVPGMRWFMELPSYADQGTNRPVQEFSVDQRATTIDLSLLTQILGHPLQIEHPGSYLTPKRTWVTRQQDEGDTVSLSDLTYNRRAERIDWWGLLKHRDWVRGQKCMGYIVSEADIYVVGDKGEHWFEPAKQFDHIEMFVDDQEVSESSEVDSEQSPDPLCIDTTELLPNGLPRFPNGVHDLKLKATLQDGRILTVDNPEFRIDNKLPNLTFDPVPRWVRQTIPLKGTTSDEHAGLREWAARLRPQGGSSWQALPDRPDPQTGVQARCSDQQVADPASPVTINCPWATQTVNDGPYDLQSHSRDLSSDNDPAEPIFGTETTDDDGNVAEIPRSTYVDNTPPNAIISGHLAEMADFGALISGVYYPVSVFSQDAGSGVVDVQLVFDGQPLGVSLHQDCPSGGCSAIWDMSFDAGSFPEGDHTLQVVVRDQVGWETAATWPVYIEHVSAGPGWSPDSASTASANPAVSIATDVPKGELLPCTAPDQPANYGVYSVGSEFDDGSGSPVPLTDSYRQCELPDQADVLTMMPGSYLRPNLISYIYGDCPPPQGETYEDDAGLCLPPLEVQSWPACERNAASYPLPPETGLQRLPRIHVRVPTGEGDDVPGAVFNTGFSIGENEVSLEPDEPVRLEVYAGDTTVVIFARTYQLAWAAAQALQKEPAEASMDPPPVTAPEETPEPLADPLQGALHGTLSCLHSAAVSPGTAPPTAPPPAASGPGNLGGIAR